jgi:putative flippase GtrA
MNKEFLRTIKYTLVAASAGLIQAVTDTICFQLLGMSAWSSYLIALILSVIWNFAINRAYTFRSNANVLASLALVALYYAVFTPLSTWWSKLFVDQWGWNNYLVLAATMLVNFVTEFCWQRLVIYRGKVDTKAGDESMKKV